MANVKNFGLIGVGSDLQFGKAGTRIINNAGVFTLKAANGTLDAALTAAGITSSGNLTLSTQAGKVIIDGTDILGKTANGHAHLFGTSGVVLPTGSTAQRGTAELGQIRVNNDVENAATVEFYDGDAWVTLATGGGTGDLAEVTQGDTGSFLKVTVDGYGRVTGNTAVVAADITGLVDGTYVNVTGDAMTGVLDMGNNKITGLAAPTAGGDATNKAYVDNAISGLSWKQAVELLANTDVALTGAFGGLTIDGRTLTIDDVGTRVLFINQTNSEENGIYTLAEAAGDYAFLRAPDTDTSADLEGAAVFVISGSTYDNTGWVQSTHSLTGFAGQQWVQFSGGGTGLTTVNPNQVLFGGASNTITQDADFVFDPATNTLAVGTATIAAPAAGDVTITATATNGDINLVPNGTGAVVIGNPGAGVIASDAGQTLTITGNNTLVLESTSGDVVLKLAAGATDKVTVSGPTAAEYATGVADADLVNKLYVDQAASTASSGSVKAVKATVNLGVAGATNIGAALPAGATILRVKVQVTSADTGTGTLVIGKSGATSAYMTDVESDSQTLGMYLAETYVVEAASTQVIATVAGSAVSGSANVIVEYQLA